MESEEYHIIGFENYLHQRKKYFIIGDFRSNTETIARGIPRSSTLGTTLFLLYVNDLPNSSSGFSFRIFADDTLYANLVSKKDCSY